jgi:hypothetical protein
MSKSLVVELQNEVMGAIRDGLAECVTSERQAPTMFSTIPVVGMFRVRRTVEISPKMQQIVAAVLSGQNDIRLDGIRIVVPTVRKYTFETPLPVFVTVAGIELDVSVRSVELVVEDGQPAILVTTESSLKPDLVVVLSVLEPVPAPGPDKFRVDDLTDKLLFGFSVPSKHHEPIKKATRHAWQTGLARKTMGDMLPKTGQFADPENVKKTAEQIAKNLGEQQVVQMGVFFWFRVGYWLVKILMALIELQRKDDAVAMGLYVGQSTTMRRSG